MKGFLTLLAIIGLGIFTYVVAEKSGMFDDAYVNDGSPSSRTPPVTNSQLNRSQTPRPRKNQSSQKLALPEYRIAADEIQDVPLKSQVELRIVIPEKPNKAALRKLLNSLFNESKQRKGFKFRKHPNAIYIYAYGPNIEPKGPAFIAMLSYNENAGNRSPNFKISSIHFDAAYEESKIKFGLTEDERRKVYWEHVLLEDRAYKAQDRGTSTDFDRVMKSGERKLKRRYKLTDDQLLQISVEATMKGWPMPAP